ncbi:MAG: CehA/McbA family metallohydrolase [Chryseolinea sp.]
MINALAKRIITFLIAVVSMISPAVAQQILYEPFLHLRNANPREWSEFSQEADKELKVTFQRKRITTPTVIELRQYDVKLQWSVYLNGKKISALIQDEHDQTSYIALPPSSLRKGKNELLISSTEAVADDIRVGQIRLHEGTLNDLMTATINVHVVDENDSILPCKLTILNSNRSLQPIQLSPGYIAATRTGNIYAASPTSFRLPPGNYTLYATRGFEYSVDSMKVNLPPGQNISGQFQLSREVNTDGWISCDTHVHTNTYSHHGDATLSERLLSIAGEGIELPIMTDHNINVDVKDTLQSLQSKLQSQILSRSSTAVTGDELTTSLGHFNVFKTNPGDKVIDHKVTSWDDVDKNIKAVNPKAIILNHARDDHSDFIPFDSSHHISIAGMNTNNWTFPANAMEVINSGSQQSHPLQLFHDWMGMLNGGHIITPVGSSDSHDVTRFLVGQGRTYIKVDDKRPSKINVDQAIDQFVAGRVMVSCGLLTKIVVNDQYGPGDLAPYGKQIRVTVEVWGPTWIGADHVALYMNGTEIKQSEIDSRIKAPLKWRETYNINTSAHDVFFAAIATGPATHIPFWSLSKPYQPVSEEWTPTVMGVSGAVWVDGDHNGIKNTAREYAEKLLKDSKGKLSKVIKKLDKYDASVAVQVAALMWKRGDDLRGREVSDELKGVKQEVRDAFESVMLSTSVVKH